MITTTVQPAGRLDWDSLILAKGSHGNGETDGYGNPLLCFMEALNVSYGRRVRLMSCPADVSRTLHSFIIKLNDALGDADRQELKRYRNRIIGTGGQPGSDQQAAYMCVDWLVRVYTPAFLRLAGLTAHADTLADADEIVDVVTLHQVTGRILAANSAALSVSDSSVYWAALALVGSADSLAGPSAYWAALAAVGSAARFVSGQKFALTMATLQASAWDLLDRMIAAYPTA